jgi:hypothetical protein
MALDKAAECLRRGGVVVVDVLFLVCKGWQQPAQGIEHRCEQGWLWDVLLRTVR